MSLSTVILDHACSPAGSCIPGIESLLVHVSPCGIESSVVEQLKKEEKLSMDGFYQRCMHNPSIKDRLPILKRTLSLNRKVCTVLYINSNLHCPSSQKYSDEERFLYFDECIYVEPQVCILVWPMELCHDLCLVGR